MSTSPKDTAELASEFWKLLRAFERNIAFAPEPAKVRLAAQARYSQDRLSGILDRIGMRLVSFDGEVFEVNLPAIAVNAEDMSAGSNCVVERTLEPAVVQGSEVILTAKVFLAEMKGSD
jgi:hypothetical protein